MKASTRKKRKFKRKSTKYFCVTCELFHTAERNNAQGEGRCKKQESLFRIERGYIHQIKKELKNGLLEFCNERTKVLGQNPFKNEINAYLKTKKSDEMLLSWRHEFNGFVLYFFPHIKKRQYAIFYNDKRKIFWDKYVMLNNLYYGEKKILKNYDLE